MNSSNDDLDPEASSGRLAGTVRRHTPIDTRDPPGAIFHFYVGDLDSRYYSFYSIYFCVHGRKLYCLSVILLKWHY